MNSYVPMFVPRLGNPRMWVHLLWRGGLQEDGTGWGGGAALTGLRVFGVQFDENCVPTQDSLLMQATAGFIFIPLHCRWAPSGTHPLLLASPPSLRAEWSFTNDCKDGSGCGSEGTCLWVGGQGWARGVHTHNMQYICTHNTHIYIYADTHNTSTQTHLCTHM